MSVSAPSTTQGPSFLTEGKKETGGERGRETRRGGGKPEERTRREEGEGGGGEGKEIEEEEEDGEQPSMDWTTDV